MDKITLQCLLKRKGGTIVPFGHHLATQVEYHFKPLDPKDEKSPHVCEFDQSNEVQTGHVGDLLAVKEAYRIYSASTPTLTIPQVQTQTDPEKHKNLYSDLLSVDAELVDGIWLEGYSREVLLIDPKSTQLLKDKLEEYGQSLAGNPSKHARIRAILKAQIAEQKASSEHAALVGKTPESLTEEDKGDEAK